MHLSDSDYGIRYISVYVGVFGESCKVGCIDVNFRENGLIEGNVGAYLVESYGVHPEYFKQLVFGIESPESVAVGYNTSCKYRAYTPYLLPLQSIGKVDIQQLSWYGSRSNNCPLLVC